MDWPGRRMLGALMAAGAIACLSGASASAAAAGAGRILYQRQLSVGSRVGCEVGGFRGSVSPVLYALKGRHPSRGALRCSRGEGVLRAFRVDVYSGFERSLGRTLTVGGARYTLEGFARKRGSALAPAFVGAGTVVLVQFPDGR